MAPSLQRRRKYHSDQKKPANSASVAAGGTGIVSALYLAFLVRFAVITEGNSNRILSAIGVLFMLVVLLALARGIREAKDNTASAESRAFGVIVPAIVLIAWLFIYVAGFVGVKL